MKKQTFFAASAKGLEDLLYLELKRLGIRDLSQKKGGVHFRGEWRDCYRANLWTRTASRILIPIAEFDADSPETLYEGVRPLSWSNYLTPGMSIAVDCNLRDSALTHSRFAALKVKDAIVDHFRDRTGDRPDVDVRNPDLRINLHVQSNRCTISLDTSGEKLHQRGYRTEKTRAPLKETLAAALVYLSEWDGISTLIDPMCGSGTIPIEAAMIAANIPPGLNRSFGFQRWPGFDQPLWTSLLEEARQTRLNDTPAIYGCDVDPKAVALAARNASRAGTGGMIDFSRQDFFNLTPPDSTGTLILNPPYGQRLGDEADLKPFYRKIGDTLKQRYKGYTAYILVGNLPLSKEIGLKPSRRIVLYNGPLECRLLKYDLY